MKNVLLILLFTCNIYSQTINKPDAKLTPGDTVDVDIATLTTPGYSNKLNGGVRNVPESVKKQVFINYFGKVPSNPGDYEIDHLISLELGGSNDIKNLWPQSYVTQPLNAHIKDKLENRMAALVRRCLYAYSKKEATQLLQQFQTEISHNWIAAYDKYVKDLSIDEAYTQYIEKSGN
jgi:hypothetical protein